MKYLIWIVIGVLAAMLATPALADGHASETRPDTSAAGHPTRTVWHSGHAICNPAPESLFCKRAAVYSSCSPCRCRPHTRAMTCSAQHRTGHACSTDPQARIPAGQFRSVAMVKVSDLSADQVSALQSALKSRGHYTGAIDGIAGPKTAAAISAFQNAETLSPRGLLTLETMERLGLVSRHHAHHHGHSHPVRQGQGSGDLAGGPAHVRRVVRSACAGASDCSRSQAVVTRRVVQGDQTAPPRQPQSGDGTKVLTWPGKTQKG